ncbi:Protein of unknown function (DUF2771) [Goodfellowiella coeruleoviolacea]|uniref:DUF2771 family protein n=1 Tax=Goodfellowiella coeruleoviolacea TaxID=334858 RepID=A0AAE3GKS3_9PSEU|nr:Protein of unknown function (DUF2771) [Goodfellowiella coeruleoviolacea]
MLFSAAGLVLVAGCAAAPLPEVTFYAAGTTITVHPTQHCDVKVEQCAAPDPNAEGRLRVPAGRPLQISVPAEVAQAPWQVVFSYHDANGTPQPDSRSDVFPAGERYAYTLTLPNPTDQLDTVEVHQYGAAVQVSETGEAEFLTRSTWVLSVTDQR